MKKKKHLSYRIGSILEPLFPSLGLHLTNSGMGGNPKEYLANCFFKAISCFLVLSVLSVAFSVFGGNKDIAVTFILYSLVFSLGIFALLIIRPKTIAAKKLKSIECNLLPALRDFKVQYNAGLSIFDALKSIAKGGYGDISELFENAVKQISTGRSQVDVFKKMAAENPSLLLRRALWQISNGLVAGGDISRILEEITRSLSEEKLNQIIRFGSKMKPAGMIYVVLAVVLPALAVTFLIILSNFLNINPKTIITSLSMIIFFIVLMQLLFFQLIKARRGNLLED